MPARTGALELDALLTLNRRRRCDWAEGDYIRAVQSEFCRHLLELDTRHKLGPINERGELVNDAPYLPAHSTPSF